MAKGDDSMALTAPAAPTPPTPPTVPQIEFSGGGSVTESTVPQSGYQSPEQVQENAARAAVARGDGALSKTTQGPSDAATAGKQSSQSGGNQTQSQRAAGGQGGQLETTTETERAPGQSDAERILSQSGQQAQSQQTAIPPSPSYHGALFWGVTFAVIFAVAFVAFRVIMRRRGGKDELTIDDIDFQSDTPAPQRPAARTTERRETTQGPLMADDIMAPDGLSGFTAAEALQVIEDEEQREIDDMRERRRRYLAERNAARQQAQAATAARRQQHQARAAQQALAAAAPQGGRMPGKAEPASEPQPAPRPRSQTASYTENRPDGAELKVISRPQQEKSADPPHFEVRI